MSFVILEMTYIVEAISFFLFFSLLSLSILSSSSLRVLPVVILLLPSHRSTPGCSTRWCCPPPFLLSTILGATVTYQRDHLPAIRAVEDSFYICTIGVGKTEFEYVEVVLRVFRDAQTRAFGGRGMSSQPSPTKPNKQTNKKLLFELKGGDNK